MDLRVVTPTARAVDAGPFVVACARNEALRLPAFLDHYRRLGIREFHLVDNDSDDGTGAYLASQPDVSLYQTRDGYAESHYGMDWLNQVIRWHGLGRWVLTVDIDELFIYPEVESVSIPGLCRYLDEAGRTAMVALLIDMYPRGPIAALAYAPGAALLEACPYFDRRSYVKPHRQFLGLPVHGGPRGRVFRLEDGRPSPFLGKVPLVRWRDGARYRESTHWLRGFKRAAVSGALLHFKYLQDFAARAELESRREEHWNQATEYKSYLDTLTADPDLAFYYDQSERLRNSAQLVELGLMRVPDDYTRRLEQLRSVGGDRVPE
jgi:glycosyltransferase involved in cell wall biosynthesis